MRIEPAYRDRIGEIASRVFAEHYSSRLWLRSSIATLGGLLRAGAGPAHGELLSYLFFAPEFTHALIRAGAEDAEAWIREHHDHGLWQHGRPVQGSAASPRRTPAMTRQDR